MCPGSPDTQLRFLHSILLKFCVCILKGTPGKKLKIICFVDLFFPLKKKLFILIMFVVKEIEVHDGTVGGGVTFLLFLLVSLRIEI